METRRLGASGLEVPVLAFGTSTFGGQGRFFSAWGDTDVAGARRLLDLCFEAGAVLFDSADVYSDGAAEEILGQALRGRRERALVATKIGLPTGPEPNQAGTSRHRLLAGVEAALRRLGTDYLDLLQLHAYDAATPLDEVLSTLDELVRSGKVRYVGVSNFAGWQLMRSLALADRHGWPRYVSHQVHYSLLCRAYEWELMALGVAEGVGALVWSPLAWGRLAGKVRPGAPPPEGSRLARVGHWGLPVDEALLARVLPVLGEVAAELGATPAQVAIAWLLHRPTVASVILGARDEAQLRENLGAADLRLSAEQVARLEAASHVDPPWPHYPYWRDRAFRRLAPPPVEGRR
ncbi:MAG: aldo/keto reductase [Porticoccaceae bacterium]|nr:MAG: aldo/keto reductase [Porticoccaceae bacterium]